MARSSSAGGSHSGAAPPSPMDFACAVLTAEARAIEHVAGHLDSEAFGRAMQLITDCRGTIIVSGMGKSGLIGAKLSATFASTGTPSHPLHPTEAMHGDLGRIRAGDVVIALSNSGQNEDVLALAALVGQDGVPVIAITSSADSHLGRIADVCLCIGRHDEADANGLAPTVSTAAMLALSDALALAVSRSRGFGADDFHKRHPGGTLGRLMMRIDEVMRLRAGDNLPLMHDTLSVAEVMAERSASGRRVGAVLLVDSDDRLSGICTDADLVRRFGHDGPAVLDRPVAEVMTANPITLPANSLVRDAVQLVRERRLDEIPVVDDDNRPVGLIDVQDLMAMKVIASE